MTTLKPRRLALALALALSACLAHAPATAQTRLPNGWRVTPAGTPIPLPGDLPLAMMFSPDGKTLMVLTGGYHDHGVSLINPQTNIVTQTVPLGKDWAGMCFDPEGDDLYVSGGGSPDAQFLAGAAKAGAPAAMLESFGHPVLHLGFADGRLSARKPIDIPGLSEAAKTPDDTPDRFIAGLATGPDEALYVINIQTDTVYKLAGNPYTVAASAHVGARPYALAVSPDGKALAVTNLGGRSVSFLRAGDLKETVRVTVGVHPNALAWAKDGRLFVANAGSNSVSVISGSTVRETIKTSLSPTDLVGSTPDALALSPDGKRLYVANADNNDVAVIDTSNAKESRVLGFIPTGWYPSALAISPDGRTLYVGTGKGLAFRGNFPSVGPALSVETQPGTSQKYDYIGGILSGTVCAVRLPDAAGLDTYTRQVAANVPMPFIEQIPRRTGAVTFSMPALHNIHHVLYIIRENRTYDQVFGDIKAGNGDPSLALFGASVTPNAHALAAQSVLLDNLYCNGEVSEDGHQWCDAAYATAFTERAWPNSYSGRGEPDGDENVTASPAGYLWDNCARHGLTYRTYGEFSSFKSSPNAPPVFTGPKTLDGHASAAWNAISFDRHDTERAALFLADLHAAEKTGVWPQFTVMSLGEDHTQGLTAGKYTPIAHVAANDQALGQIVEGVSQSRFWKDTAIFVIEDDAQNGPDHVDAHRTAGLVLSPYVKHNLVDHTQYTTASMVRTMELILHLPPMTQYDQDATPMLACFTGKPDLTAYTNIGPKVDLEARNPVQGPGAVASAKLDLSAPDRADPDALNAILWSALRPGVKMPAPVRSARLVH